MPRRLTRLLPLILTAVLVMTGCTADGDADQTASEGASPGVHVTDGDGDAEPRRFLRPFDSCDALRSYFVDQASELVGPYGLGQGGVRLEAEAMAGADDAAADTAEAAPAQGTGDDVGQAVSGTNVQEQGVDEPDIVKTDGEIIVTAAAFGGTEGELSVVDVASEQVVATIPLPEGAFNAELLMDGDDLLILAATSPGGTPGPADLVPAFPAERTTVTRVDLSDPADPQVLGGVRMEGAYRSARMVDGTVRLVMVSQPTGLAFTHPTDSGLSAEQQAEDENRRILNESDIDDWVPHLQTVGADGDDGEVQRLMDCTAINQPRQFSGLSTLSVVTFDLQGDTLTPTSSAALVASGDTVYASTERLIVATSPWGRWAVPFIDVIGPPREPEDIVTDLHSFDISDAGATSYVASGSVEGTLIGQFALSETDGVIRVATTTQPDWFGGGVGNEDSESSLITLTEQGEELVHAGRLDGLGVTEQIQAVRYLSPDLAAVITFRQTDPLYLIDTSHPADPTLLGELKIPGFSSYLHPVGDGYLLGVGQDADEETGRQLGLQASLFDIRDRTDPQQVARVSFGSGFSPVEHDHRAFLWWAPTGQAVIPAELHPDPEAPVSESPGDEPVEDSHGPTFVGAIVLDVGDGTLSEQGRVAQDDPAPGEYRPGVMRSMVIGDDLWTLSQDALARHTLEGLERQAVIPL